MKIDLLFSTPIYEETIVDKDLTNYIKTIQKKSMKKCTMSMRLLFGHHFGIMNK